MGSWKIQQDKYPTTEALCSGRSTRLGHLCAYIDIPLWFISPSLEEFIAVQFNRVTATSQPCYIRLSDGVADWRYHQLLLRLFCEHDWYIDYRQSCKIWTSKRKQRRAAIKATKIEGYAMNQRKLRSGSTCTSTGQWWLHSPQSAWRPIRIASFYSSGLDHFA